MVGPLFFHTALRPGGWGTVLEMVTPTLEMVSLRHQTRVCLSHPLECLTFLPI